MRRRSSDSRIFSSVSSVKDILSMDADKKKHSERIAVLLFYGSAFPPVFDPDNKSC